MICIDVVVTVRVTFEISPTVIMSSIPEPPAGHTRPIVFFDVAIGDTKLPRIKMELFDDIVPKCVVIWGTTARIDADCARRTAENFRQLCTGEMR
jgi:peptidyl-prolyl isomerase H (cyclophilin H)